jgi:hypothetical protein
VDGVAGVAGSGDNMVRSISKIVGTCWLSIAGSGLVLMRAVSMDKGRVVGKFGQVRVFLGWIEMAVDGMAGVVLGMARVVLGMT